MKSITFVTSFYIVTNEKHKKDFDQIQCFLNRLFSTNCYFHIYVDPEFNVMPFSSFANVYFDNGIAFPKFGSIELVKQMNYRFPRNRDAELENQSNILYQHNKYWFLEHAVSENRWNSTHYSWIESDVFYNLENREELYQLFNFYNAISISNDFLVIPSNLTSKPDLNPDKRCSKYVSTFVLGDKGRVLNWTKLMQTGLQMYIRHNRILPFSTNLLSWVEKNNIEEWNVQTYQGNNVNFFHIPFHLFCPLLIKGKKQKEKFYEIPGFYASNTNFLQISDKEGYMNIRYINYYLGKKQTFFDKAKMINTTKNIAYKVTFDEEDQPVYQVFKIMKENIHLPRFENNRISLGVEDIRLFPWKGKIMYIGTTLEYSHFGKSRMIMGTWDFENGALNDAELLHPPDLNSPCEKNWIPMIENDELWFIYKWWPFEVGQLEQIEGRNQLVIKKTHSLPPNRWMERFRGSTCFHEEERGLIGVVHFREYVQQRVVYFHCLVVLDKTSWIPIYVSHPFCFFKYEIEYCIGFKENIQDYSFWVSRNDRNPVYVIKNKEDFSWYNV